MTVKDVIVQYFLKFITQWTSLLDTKDLIYGHKGCCLCTWMLCLNWTHVDQLLLLIQFNLSKHSTIPGTNWKKYSHLFSLFTPSCYYLLNVLFSFFTHFTPWYYYLLNVLFFGWASMVERSYVITLNGVIT